MNEYNKYNNYLKRMIDKELTIKQNEYVLQDYCFKNIFFQFISVEK